MKYTLKDVATECGLSVYAVSRVINNKPIYLVEEKRRKILDTAKKMNYRPNLLAKSLKSRKSNIIGLIVSDISDPFYLELIADMEKILSESGYSLLVSGRFDNLDKELEALSIMQSRECELILISSRFDIKFDSHRRKE